MNDFEIDPADPVTWGPEREDRQWIDNGFELMWRDSISSGIQWTSEGRYVPSINPPPNDDSMNMFFDGSRLKLSPGLPYVVDWPEGSAIMVTLKTPDTFTSAAPWHVIIEAQIHHRIVCFEQVPVSRSEIMEMSGSYPHPVVDAVVRARVWATMLEALSRRGYAI